ncbi:MAG: hypothetical protein AAF682_19790 [Planctomycetota bacterium]
MVGALFLALASLAVPASGAGTAELTDGERLAQHRAILAGLFASCEYRVLVGRRHSVFGAEGAADARELLLTLGEELRRPEGPCSPAAVLARLRAFHDRREPQGWQRHSERDLFVTAAPDRIVEAYYNDDDERDYVTLWTPSLYVAYNPGRHSVNLQLAPRPSTLVDPRQLYQPLWVGPRTADGDGRTLLRTLGDGGRQGFLFRGPAEGEALVVETAHGLPVAAARLVGEICAFVAEFTYGPAADDPGRLALSSVARIDFIRDDSSVQVSSYAYELRDFRVAPGEPRPIEVSTEDSLFELAPEALSSQFAGNVGSRGLPAALEPYLRVAREPRVQWRRE